MSAADVVAWTICLGAQLGAFPQTQGFLHNAACFPYQKAGAGRAARMFQGIQMHLRDLLGVQMELE